MKVYIILFLLATSVAYSATTEELRIAYKKEFAKELENPKSKWYYTHTDSYARLLHVKIMRKLGLDPALDLFQDERKGSVPEVQSHDTMFVFDVSKNASSQDETTISINKKNRNIIIAGANDGGMYSNGMPVYRSTNAGKSWQTHRIRTGNSELIAAGDPAIICDNDGTFYYAFLSFVSSTSNPDLQVARSTDGRTWTTGAAVAGGTGLYFEDKEWIAIDDNPNSPFYGRLYIVWMRYSDVDDGSGIYVASSTDKGMTWSEPVYTYGAGTFVLPRVTKDGTLLFTYSAGGFDGEQGVHVLVSSTDGGSSFEQQIITYYTSYPTNTNLNRPGLKGDEGFRAYPATSFDVDPVTGEFHIVYSDWNINSSGIESAVLYHTSSNDLGATWTQPIMLGIIDSTNPNAYNDRFFSWLAADRVTGKKHLIYYSSEDDPYNIETTVYHLELDASLAKQPEALKEELFDPLSVTSGNSPFLGDYIGCDAHDSVFAACWTENRPNFNDGDVFVAVKSPIPDATTGVKKILISSSSIWMSEPYPNPSTNRTAAISYYVPQTTTGTLSLYDTKGSLVKTFFTNILDQGTQTKEISLGQVPVGIYFIKLSSQIGEVTKRLVIE